MIVIGDTSTKWKFRALKEKASEESYHSLLIRKTRERGMIKMPAKIWLTGRNEMEMLLAVRKLGFLHLIKQVSALPALLKTSIQGRQLKIPLPAVSCPLISRAPAPCPPSHSCFMIVLWLKMGVFLIVFLLFHSVTSAVTAYNVGVFKPTVHDLSSSSFGNTEIFLPWFLPCNSLI